MVIFEDNSDVGHGHAVVGTVSGTTPSFGTGAISTDDPAVKYIDMAFDRILKINL